jgi:hypothetical protein
VKSPSARQRSTTLAGLAGAGALAVATLAAGALSAGRCAARPYEAPFAADSVLGSRRVGADSSHAGPDSTVLLFPVRKSPALLLLRAHAPLAVAASLPPGAREAWGAAAPGATLVRRDAWESEREGTGRGAFAEPPGSSGDRISVSGSKSFAVELGRRRDASLSQGLDLSLRGRIAGDVDLAATLSDRALPFEPDGATRELEEIDRLSLAVRAPGGEATLGDFRLDAFPGEFARVSRELQGVRGAARVRGSRWDVTAAGAKGERRSAEFRGEEGKQGPYVLAGRSTSNGGEGGIVAGSETVWLDGLKLRRGADADYVVDYAAGTITFTVRRSVGSSSRIAVDYEASASRYKRQLYAAATKGGGARGGWYAAYLREGDDWRRPYGAELSREDRQALEGAGDGAEGGAPLPSGVRYVGPGLGSYAWDESDAAAPRWVYLGPTRGDHEVEFAEVGAGEGAYRDTLASDGTRFYRYLGPTLGSYAPGRSVAVPAAAALIDAGGSARIGSALTLDGEIARSSLDRNLLSDRDDGDNAGVAARAALRLDPRPLGLFGRRGTWRAGLSVRSRDQSFASFDRLDPAFEGDRWNQRNRLGSSSDVPGERRFEGTLQVDPSAAASFRGEWGHRRLSDGNRATRRAAEAEWRGLASGAARWEEARNEGDGGRGLRARWSLDLGRDRGVVQPRFRAGTERVAGAEGDSLARRSSRTTSGSLALVPSTRIRFRAGMTWRRDADAPRAPEPGNPAGADGWRTVRSRAFDGGATVRTDAVSVDASIARRRSRGEEGTTDTDLAQLVLAGGRAGGPLTSEIRWDVSQVREPERQRSLVAVGAGSGSYDATGTLAPGGGYEFVSTLGPEATRTRASWQLRVDAYPGRAAGASRGKVAGARRAWRSLGASTLIRVDSDSRLPLGRLERAFRFSDYLDAEATRRGEWSGRQTVEFVPAGATHDLRVEAGARREMVGDLSNLRVSRATRDLTFRARHAAFARVRLAERVTVDRSRYESTRSDSPDRTRSRLRGGGAEVELSRAAGPQWNLALVGRYRLDRDASRGGEQTTWSAGPSVRCAAASRLRVDARAFWGRTDQRGTYAPAGSVIAPVLGERLDYDLLSEWSVRERMQLSLGWKGAAIPGRAANYEARLELRSSF